MAADLQSACANLWRKILNTDPLEVLGPSNGSVLLQRHPYDRLAQPGYVGADYEGLVFVSQRPGAGGDGLGASDMRQYQLLKRLRDSSDVRPAYDLLMAALSQIMPDWRIVQNCQIKRILSHKRMRFTAIAFINLVAWRTQGNSIPAGAYAVAWASHVCEQIRILNPTRIIALGVPARNWLEKGGIKAFDPADTIKRRQADMRLLPEGEKTVERICNDEWRP